MKKLMVWTPDMLETLQKMWGEDHFVKEIAAHFNTSENSVKAKARRMGFVRFKRLPKQSTPSRPPCYVPRNKEAVNTLYGQGIPLEHHKNNQCVWIVGNLCCGAPIYNKSAYCENHYRISRRTHARLGT